MATLVLQCEDRVAYAYAIDRVVTIGRLADNRIVLDHPSVSSHHACVFTDDDRFIVEDLQSTNGTFVNSRRVSRRTLRNGDVLKIGTRTIMFDQLANAHPGKAGTAGDAPIEETIFFDNRTLLDRLLVDADTHRRNEVLAARLTELNEPASRDPQATAAADVPGVLRVVAGSADQDEYRLDKQTSLIGKAKASLVRLNGWFTPSVAVAITRNRQGYVATLVGGKTFVNHQPLNARRHELKDGDLLEVSGLVLEFRARA
jgi:pSer/pThr/pTyr-binding forkhead associated (FHA) protein